MGFGLCCKWLEVMLYMGVKWLDGWPSTYVKNASSMLVLMT